jgi:cytochrome c-type biogenesis protein CcmE
LQARVDHNALDVNAGAKETMRIRPRFLIGVGLIAAAIGYLIFSSIRTTSEYYLTVPEVAAPKTELGGRAIRVAGRVKPGNIAWDPNSLTLKFEIAPIPDLEASGAPVKPVSAVASDVAADPVSFRVVSAGEPKPDMFAPGRDVIVEGKLGPDGGRERKAIQGKQR